MASVNVGILITVFLGCCWAECPHGWLHFQDSCYLFSADSLSWYDASSMCRAHHSYLVIIESQEENLYVGHEATGRKSTFWLGATDDIYEGEWLWSSTERPLSFTDWSPGQPDNYGNNEDCLEIYESQNKWNDKPCSTHSRYICERQYPGDGQNVIGK